MSTPSAPTNSARYTDRVVIITGSASGIGLATAQRIGSEGGRIVLADLSEEKLLTAARDVTAAGAPEVLTIRCDVSNEKDVDQVFAQTLERFGRVDLVVNNAGVMIFKPLVEHEASDWTKVLGIDLMGAFYFTRGAFRAMKNGGAIVNVSSVHAVETTPLVASYAAAKAAILSLTRSAAIEGKEKNIRACAVLPGAVETPMLRENPNIKSGLETINQSDVGRPEDIASAIAFLGSSDANFITGDGIRVDGGRLSRL